MQGNGVLQLQWGNMLQVHDLHEADIVFLETDGACARARVHIKESAQRSHNRAAFRATVAQDVYHSLCQLLLQMKEGGRILSYLDIRKIWDLGPFPFHQQVALEDGLHRGSEVGLANREPLDAAGADILTAAR